MEIKYKSKIVATLMALFLAGCGGGGDGDADNTTTTSSSYAYYIDSAVSGLTYECGTQSGTTDSDGKFYFDEGSSCRFLIGDLVLKAIDANRLEALSNGETLQETDTNIARILQTLDRDHDTSNGITIEQESDTVTAFVHYVDDNSSYTSDGSNASSLLEALNKAANEDVISVNVTTELEANAHLLHTILSDSSGTLLVGDASSAVYASLMLADSATDSLTLTSANQLEEEDSDTVTFNENTDTLTIGSVSYDLNLVQTTTDDMYYVQLNNSEDNTQTLRIYPYAYKGAAESYLAGNLLSNDILYLVENYSTGVQAFTYSDATYDTFSPQVTLAYGDSNWVMTFTAFTSEYANFTYTSGDATGSGRLYYGDNSATAANAYWLTLEPDDSSELTFTDSMVASGLSLYLNDGDLEKITFGDNSTANVVNILNNEEDDGEDSITYALTDGKLVFTITDTEDSSVSTTTFSLVSVGDVEGSYIATEESDDEDESDDTVILYTSRSALESTFFDDLDTTRTVTDESDDSTNVHHAGFELTTLSAEENSSGRIEITLTANGSISDALATDSASENGYVNMLWIGVNDSIEFGMKGNGEKWALKDYWQDGVYVEGGSLDTDIYSFSVSSDGKTVTITLDSDQVPSNDYGYFFVDAAIGENCNSCESEDVGDHNYDEVQLGSLWQDNTLLAGAWVNSAENAPFADIVVFLDKQNYVIAQQALSENSVIGGVEAGIYTYTHSATADTASDAVPTIDSNGAFNGGATLRNTSMTVYSNNNEVLDIADDDQDLTKIVASDSHPEAGAWLIEATTDGGIADNALVVFDGHGHYMEIDLYYGANGFYEDDGTLENASEFGTYVISSDNSTITFTADPTTTTNTLVCTDDDESDCGTVAGDSNMSAGFSDENGQALDYSLKDDVMTIIIPEDENPTLMLNRVQ